MAWRHLAAGAAGVVAAVGLGAHGAAADDAGASDAPADPSTPAAQPGPTTTTTLPKLSPEDQAKLDRAHQLNAFAQTMPTYTAPKKQPVADDTPAANRLAFVSTLDGAAPPSSSKVAQRFGEASRLSRAVSAHNPSSKPVVESAAQTPAAAAPSASPADDPSPQKHTSSGPVQATTATTSTTSTATPTLPSSVDGATASQAWWPTWAADLVDQRIDEAWRETPVRGPPPGVASALGNDGRTTIYQVSIVTGKDGTDVSITAHQGAAVLNAGVAQADAVGSGSATSTGDVARTSITQVSVVVQRGTGTANVAQDASVVNAGMGVAASAGPANAKAIGNASSTTVNQTAVVLILGSGDATLSQRTDVLNAGDATAVATDRQATATGSTATTDVNQTAVLVVHDDDVNVSQSTTTVNVGIANAGGGTAVGNNSSNTTTQISVYH